MSDEELRKKQKEHKDWMDSLSEEEFQIAVRTQNAIYNTLNPEEEEEEEEEGIFGGAN